MLPAQVTPHILFLHCLQGMVQHGRLHSHEIQRVPFKECPKIARNSCELIGAGIGTVQASIVRLGRCSPGERRAPAPGLEQKDI